ncbi:Nonsense-mediated mRNA decay factor SMG8, partial [Pseudolycoriella hygida]
MLRSFVFPDIPPDLSDLLFRDDKQVVVVGVLGKSSHADCNKLAGFKILDFYPSLASSTPRDGRITFYFKETENVLYVHFESTFDEYVLKDLEKIGNMQSAPLNFHEFHSRARTKFARILLFATQICHIIVLVETGKMFDASYLSMFKALKTIRERYILKFLPKLLKNSNAGTFMGKDGRLCSPRIIFMFERCLLECRDADALQKLEFDIEDRIYKMLRTEFIITNNSSISLFSIPRNQRYVYVNDDPEIRSDPLIDSIDNLMTFIDKASSKEKVSDDWEDIRPIKGFAKPLRLYREPRESDKPEKPKQRSIVDLLNVHINEALRTGFDDSVSKFKGKSHFV